MTRRSVLLPLCVLASISILTSVLSGCKSWSERGAKGLGTLPPASPNETKFSPYQPAHPYQQIVKGLLGRKIHAATPAEAGAAIELHDFLVGPNQKTDSYTLQAPAIFEVKSGKGVLKVNDKAQQIETGMVIDVPAAPFTIENQTSVAIAIRVEILGSK